MTALRLLAASSVVMVLALGLSADPPAPKPAASCLPVGKWTIEFTNGVVENCVIRRDESITVVEPLRSSAGRASIRDGSVVMTCDDDRVERWTEVGERMVVEHWFPAAQFPSGTPVLGIAERAK
jgi:hypothetical protein